MVSEVTMGKPGDGWANKTLLKKNQLNSFVCLCTFEDLPPWHFRHRGISGGYRYCHSFLSALLSVFYWHNESINVWLHYGATIGLLLQLYYTNTNYISNFDRNLIVSTAIAGNVFPMFISGFCHHFYGIDEIWHTVCWFLDFIGILSGMYFTAINYLYITFYCDSEIVRTLVIVLGIGYVTSIIWCGSIYIGRLTRIDNYPKDRFPEFSKVLSSYAVFSSFLPLGLTIFMKPEYFEKETLTEVFIASCTGPVIMALGIVFFAQGGFPERHLPQLLGLPMNTFDYLGHSHQFWHVVSASLMFWWIHNTSKHYNARMSMSC